MNNHLSTFPKQVKFYLKCSKMRWRLHPPQTPLGQLTTLPDPLVGRGFASSALANT